MIDKKTILERVATTEKLVDQPPAVGAFATEIGSNAEVVGNQNSQCLYNVTPEKDNGLQKMSSENKYLEKIAVAKWFRNLGTSIKHAEPITQLGVGTSILGTGLSVNRTMNSGGMAKRDAERARREQLSIKALHSINKSISTNVMAPSSVPVKRPKGL
jgi:hypothetical protein